MAHMPSAERKCLVNTGKLPAKALWLDGVMSSDYELDTLPLLFASSADFSLYYNTLLSKHKGRHKDILKIEKLNLAGRLHRDKGAIRPCLQVLEKCVHLRRSIFDDEDYQFYAAMVHYLLTIMYFASSNLATGESNEAYELFALAKSEIQEWGPCITKSDRALLLCILNNNWANYWFRRGKMNAATQCCCRAYQFWMRVTDLSVHVLSFLSPFLIARFAASLVMAHKDDEALKIYNKFLKSFPPEDEEKEEPQAAARGVGEGQEEAVINVNITTLSLLDPTDSSASSKCCLRSISISLTPLAEDDDGEIDLCATNWSLLRSSKYISVHNCGYAKLATRKYRSALDILERAAWLFNKCFENSGVKGNPHWWRQLDKAYNYAAEMCEDRTLEDFRIKNDEHKDKDLMSYQRILSKEARKQVLLKKAKRYGVEVDPAELNTVSTAIIKDATDDSEVKGTAEAWEKFIPILAKGGRYQDGVKELKKARAQSALGASSIRHLAGDMVRHVHERKQLKKEAQMEIIRAKLRPQAMTPPPPSTTSKELMADRLNPNDADEEPAPLAQSHPTSQGSGFQYVLSLRRPQVSSPIGAASLAKNREIKLLKAQQKKDRLKPVVVAGVHVPASNKHFKSSPKPVKSEPSISSEGEDPEDPEDMLDNCLMEYLAEETKLHISQDAGHVEPQSPPPFKAEDVAAKIASKLAQQSYDDITSEEELIKAQIKALQEEYDKKATAECSDWLTGAIQQVEEQVLMESQEAAALVQEQSESSESKNEVQGDTAKSENEDMDHVKDPNNGSTQEPSATQGPEGNVVDLATEPAAEFAPAAASKAELGAEQPAADVEEGVVQERVEEGNESTLADIQEEVSQERTEEEGPSSPIQPPLEGLEPMAEHTLPAIEETFSNAEEGDPAPMVGQEHMDRDDGDDGDERESIDSIEFLGFKRKAYIQTKPRTEDQKRTNEKLVKRKPLLGSVKEMDLETQNQKLKGLLQYLEPHTAQYEMVVKEMQVNNLRMKQQKKAERQKIKAQEEEAKANAEKAMLKAQKAQEDAAAGMVFCIASALAATPSPPPPSIISPTKKKKRAKAAGVNSMIVLDGEEDGGKGEGAAKSNDRKKRPGIDSKAAPDTDEMYEASMHGMMANPKPHNTMEMLP